MISLIVELIGFVSEIILDIQEWLFQKKKKKRREFEKTNNLPKKRMISPYMRMGFLFVLFAIVYVVIRFSVENYTAKSKTISKIEELKVLIAKEKEFLGKYPEKLESVIRNNPLNKGLIKDSWDNNFRYELVDNGNSYILFSAGKDRKFNTEDDIR